MNISSSEIASTVARPPGQAALRVTLEPQHAVADLEGHWRSLESCGQVSFFQSWDWIGSLLEALPHDHEPDVLRVFFEDRLVCIGLLWRGTHWRHGFVHSRSLHLNETGLTRFDGITVEHNGLVAARGFEGTALSAALDYLRTRSDWDELYLSGIAGGADSAWARSARERNLWVLTRWEKPFYYVDLHRIRNAGRSYLDSLSANTRYQIRRAMKAYASRGDLHCESASSIDEARAWFASLVTLHQGHWVGKGQPGAFGSEFALGFHASLISRGWPRGSVRIARIRAGTDVLGYVYNFCRGDVVYNYQSGYVAEDDSKLKPGLVCHSLAVDLALRDGFAAYDLLMGGGHFKPSLTNASGVMAWSVVQRRRLALGIENFLRSSRDRLRSRVAAQRERAGNAR